MPSLTSPGVRYSISGTRDTTSISNASLGGQAPVSRGFRASATGKECLLLEIVYDLLSIAGRIFTIFPLLLFVAMFMGRRLVGELPVFDFLIILALGSLVGADIAEPDINHWYVAFAIVVVGILQRIVAGLTLQSQSFKKLITFAPVIVIKDGVFLEKNLRRINYSLENILEFLRGEGIFNISDVDIAIIEANGRLSVYKKPQKNPATLEELGVAPLGAGIAHPVIIEGKIIRQTLNDLHLTEEWLAAQLNARGIPTAQAIFFSSVDGNNQIHISPYNRS